MFGYLPRGLPAGVFHFSVLTRMCARRCMSATNALSKKRTADHSVVLSNHRAVVIPALHHALESAHCNGESQFCEDKHRGVTLHYRLYGHSNAPQKVMFIMGLASQGAAWSYQVHYVLTYVLEHNINLCANPFATAHFLVHRQNISGSLKTIRCVLLCLGTCMHAGMRSGLRLTLFVVRRYVYTTTAVWGSAVFRWGATRRPSW